MKRWLESIWWQPAAPPFLLRFLESIYAVISGGLAVCKRSHATRLPVPVIVVGNIAVGGTGKTPVTLALIECLQALGARPGVLSRGYGGSGPFPLLLSSETSAHQAGDEPVLMAQRTGVPVCVAPSRVQAGRYLLAAHPEVDVLLCDDGLQHLTLVRDLEFCVVDGRRGHGNGHLLPAGPLRERPARMAQCALVLVNGGDATSYGAQALRFDLLAEHAIALHTGERRSLSAFSGQTVQALAGIGNPQRFFDLLAAQGMTVHTNAFSDHHIFSVSDLDFAGDSPVMMTEKDAVKCRELRQLSDRSLWWVPVNAVFSQGAHERVQECLKSLLALRRSSP